MNQRLIVEWLKKVLQYKRSISVGKLLVAMIQLDVTHQDVVAVKTNLAQRTGIRIPVVHGMWGR